MERINRNIVGSRFGMICRKLLVEKRKNLLTMTIGYIGFCLAYGLIMAWFGAVPAPGNFVTYILLAGLACSIVAAGMFSDTIDKEGKIAVLMTPASAFDKFIPRLIAVVPGMMILSVAGYIVYGYSDILIFGITNNYWVDLYFPIEGWNKYSTQTLFLILSWFLFSESLFIFGAVVWPKRSFLKTVCLMAGLMIFFGCTAWLFARGMKESVYAVQITDEDAFAWSVITIIFLISMGITYSAYYLFKRKTIA